MKLTGQVIPLPQSAPRPAAIRFSPTGVLEVADRPAAAEPFIVPGLIDSHTHPLDAGLLLLFADLDTCRSVAEVLDRIRTRSAQARDIGMLFAYRLDPDSLAEKRYPTRDEIDTALSDVPVLVYRIDGHSAVTNSAGLALAGERTLRFPGVDKDGAGNPSGVLRGQAYERTARLFKRRLQPEHIQESLRLAGTEAASRGVTTLAGLVGLEDTSDDEWRVMLEALAAMPVRAETFIQTWNAKTAVGFGLKRIGGCLLIDGSFGSRTAALAADYSDATGSDGVLYVSDEQLTNFLRQANEAGLQTAVHAIGDRAMQQVLRCHEQVGVNSDNRLRHRVEHAELLAPDQIAQLARLGLVLGVQPAFEARWGGPDRMYSQRLGERWRRTNPFRSLLDAGVALAGGSDAPITPIDPVAGIRAAMNHPNPDQRVTGFEALAMFTTTAAYSLGIEKEAGSIEPGRQADFTVLTADPRSGEDIEVVATFRSGKCIYKNDKLSDRLHMEE